VAGQPNLRAERKAILKSRGASRERTATKRRILRQAKAEAQETAASAVLRASDGTGGELAVAPATSTTAILAWAMRRVHGTMLMAAHQADAVPMDKFWVRYYDAQGNIRTEPNKWFQLEQAMRNEAVRLAAKMVELGLAERQVALEEAKAVMVAQAVRTAAEAAGLNDEQVHRLGEELRKGLESGAIVETAA